MRVIKKFLICLIFMNIILSSLYGSCVIMWTQQYDSGVGQSDGGQSIALDNSGNVYVTGYKNGGWVTPGSFYTIKYDNDGTPLWTQEYNSGNNNSGAGGIALDSFENVYITGHDGYNASPPGDIITIKYSNNGNSIWTQRYNDGNSDLGYDIVTDNYGYVYIIGSKDNHGSRDYVTIKYSNNGNSIWTQEYDNGTDDLGHEIAVDNFGNIYVTGFINHGGNENWAIIKYDNNGNSIWTQKYDSGGNNDRGDGIAVDNLGYVYVTGSGNNNYFTIKYDSDGNSIWTQQYDSGGNDAAYSIAVDNLRYVYVTGSGNNNYFTIKYDSDGNTIWTQEYDSGNSDSAYGVAVDNSGYVYITGLKNNVTDSDYFTIKYLQPPYPDPSSLSGSSTADTVNLTWQDNTINESGFKIERSYNGVNYSVIGRTPKNTSQFQDISISQQTTYWYRITATNAAGESAFVSVIIARAPTYTLDNVVLVPNPFNPNKSPKNYITFFNCPDDITIKIYDILGDKIKELASPNAEHKIIWDVKDSGGRSLARGMYMAILKNSKGKKRTIKFLIHR